MNYSIQIQHQDKPHHTSSSSSYPGPSKPSSFEQEEGLLVLIEAYIKENLSNADLTVEGLAKYLCLSRSNLFRRMKTLINQKPNAFIRNYRLDIAMEMLKNKQGNVYEVAWTVGFEDSKYFSRRFKERFGYPPSKVKG